MKLTRERKLVRLLHTLLDTLPDFVYIKDTKSRFLFANKSVSLAMGVKTPDDVIGKTDFDFHPPELAQQYYDDEQALIRSGQPLINREEPVKDQEAGEIRWFLTSKIPFFDHRGHMEGFIGINRDITQRRQIEQELARRMKERTEELETLRRIIGQISNIAQRLGNTSEEMTDMSTQMATEAEQTSQQVALVSSNSQQISQHTTAVSVSIEEFAANIQETSRAVTHVTAMMTNALNLVSAANTAITDLETQSQEIGKISAMITSIAQQTRLLALNATIESARAGDAGQGFKVVAGEVKELARETSAAAEDIAKKIDQIQVGSQETASAVTEVLKIIHQVSEISNTIAAGMAEQTHVTQEIARNVTNAAQGSQGITHAIADIASVSRGAATRASNIQDEAQELSSLAEQLRQLVRELHLGIEDEQPDMRPL